MCRTVWGLPQAGILANKLLQKHLLPHGYYECMNTPGLWKHKIRPISFTLVVNDFGIKYIGKDHVNHLIWCIKQKYELTEDWTGNLYFGIQLKWDYNARTLDILMLGYSKKVLQSTSIANRQNHNIAPTLLHQNSTAEKPKPPSLLTSLPNCSLKISKKSSTSLGVYCTMHVPSTSPSLWC